MPSKMKAKAKAESHNFSQLSCYVAGQLSALFNMMNIIDSVAADFQGRARNFSADEYRKLLQKAVRKEIAEGEEVFRQIEEKR